jgi:hypothetical protein
MSVWDPSYWHQDALYWPEMSALMRFPTMINHQDHSMNPEEQVEGGEPQQQDEDDDDDNSQTEHHDEEEEHQASENDEN